MKVAVFVLALIGGILALLGTIAGLGLVGVAKGLGADQGQASEDSARLFIGLIISIATIVAGSMVLTNHSGRTWGLSLIALSIIGSIAAGAFYLIGGLLGLVAGILALLVPTPTPQAAFGPTCPRCRAPLAMYQPICGQCGMPINWQMPQPPAPPR